MYKNYFFLARIAKELNEHLQQYTLHEAFCQEKDRLVLGFSGPEGKLFLEIQVSKNEPWLVLRDDFSRARKNVVSFFEDFLPLQIESVFISHLERTIWFSGSEYALAFILHGNHTNFCVFRGKELVASFKSVSDEALKVLLIKATESKPASMSTILHEVSLLENTDRQALKKQFPSFGPEVLDEFENRVGGECKSPGIILRDIIRDIISQDLHVGTNNKTNEFTIIPGGFSAPAEDEVLCTPYALRALREFIWHNNRTDSTGDLLKQLTNELKKRITNLEVREKKLIESLESDYRVQENRKTGELLAAHIYLLKKGMQEIELEDFHHAGEKVKIPLKEELTPQQNIDVYFKKARSLEQSLERSREELPKVTIQLERMRARYAEIRAMDYHQLKELTKKMETQDRKHNRTEDQPKTIKFIIDGKYTLLVGKDSKNNDQLTLHVAKQEDLWFHARSVPGSHVVLQVNNSKEEIQKSVIKKAAAVAAFYSKAKNAGLVPVSFTKKKYVVKRKGMPAGQVMLMREDSVMVKPGIPDGVEQIKDSSVDDLLSFD
jgi:predicted ribosome quality control (RQC) complex YloA/Tae2 family protein